MERDKLSSSALGIRQKFYFQFVTTPTSDTPGTSLLLHFDNRRYFFGRIAEGTQRACIQRGVGIKKLRNLFLTGPTTWNNMGGLIGMVLTLADVQLDERDPITGKRPHLRIHGGPKLMHSIACARRFVFRTGMPIDIQEANIRKPSLEEPTYVDDNVDVWSIPIQRRGRSGAVSPRLLDGRSQSPNTIDREQSLRADTVKNMFDSEWRKDRLVESRFDEVRLPALIWTRNPETKDLTSTMCTTMADAPHLEPSSRVLVRNPWPASLIEELPPVDNIGGSVAMSYIVKGKSQRGKFLPQKAKELGVKPGPNYAILTVGGSVTLDSGAVITPDMVLGPTEPGKGMAIFDVPSNDYLGDLSEKLEHLKTGMMQGVETVSWILGPGVVVSPEFNQVIDSLPNLKHIVSSSDTNANYLALDSSAASLIRLSQIRPECFKVPVHNNKVFSSQTPPQDALYVPAERGLLVQVAPKFLMNKTEVPPLLDVKHIKASYRNVLKDLIPTSTDSAEPDRSYDDVTIITLGTGSAVPSKYRNVSGTLMRIPGLGSYLFDCGENTLGMLQRAYMTAELEEVLVDLRMIWISHLHADHHLGTLSVLEAKKQAMQRLGKTEPKLYVVSEPNMADYLIDYSSVQPSDHCQLLGVLNSEFVTKRGGVTDSLSSISETSLPIEEFLTTRVSHCHGAQACSITFDNGFKFSYSGDCRPSAQFAKIGQNSDVLLHEATFEDGLEGDAVAKKHSTTGEALAVAHAMKAKNVVLTHFSQRYQKLPVLSEVKSNDVQFEESNDNEETGPIENDFPTQNTEQESGALDAPSTSLSKSISNDANAMATLQKVAKERSVCVAFDLMSVTVGQIRDMYKYYPAIEKMFEMELEKSESRRDERRAANDRVREGKEMKDNKWKKDAGKQAKQQPKTEGNLYERINRNKSKTSKETNNIAAVDGTTANITGQLITPRGNPPQPEMSNRARRRQQQLRTSRDLQTSPETTALLSPGLTADSKVARQLSVGPEPDSGSTERKRVKLDDEDARDGNEVIR